MINSWSCTWTRSVLTCEATATQNSRSAPLLLLQFSVLCQMLLEDTLCGTHHVHWGQSHSLAVSGQVCTHPEGLEGMVECLYDVWCGVTELEAVDRRGHYQLEQVQSESQPRAGLQTSPCCRLKAWSAGQGFCRPLPPWEQRDQGGVQPEPCTVYFCNTDSDASCLQHILCSYKFNTTQIQNQIY